jgi:hypothetical protein
MINGSYHSIDHSQAQRKKLKETSRLLPNKPGLDEKLSTNTPNS